MRYGRVVGERWVWEGDVVVTMVVCCYEYGVRMYIVVRRGLPVSEWRVAKGELACLMLRTRLGDMKEV